MWKLTDFPDYPLSGGFFFFPFSLKLSAAPAVITDGRISSAARRPFFHECLLGITNILKLPLQYQFLNHMDDISL